MKNEKLRKRWLSGVICLVFLLLCHLQPLTASGEGGETLTVGVPVDRCPVFYLDQETNEVVGLGTDLMRIVAENAGYTVAFRQITENTLKEALDNEEYDVVMPFGSAISSASGHPTVISENLIQMPFTLVTIGKRDVPQLHDLRVGMLRSQGSVAETVRQLYPSIEINRYETMSECVKALREGQVDALLQNSYVWSYVLQKPSYQDLVVQPATVFTMDFRAGTRDGAEGQALIERLNQGIAALKEAQRQTIILDYTSRRLYQYEFSDYLYQYRWILAGALLLIAAVISVILWRIHAIHRKHEEEIRRLVDHDPLTGLYSINGFRKRVQELLHAHPNKPYFLSYNNIRDFKFINDSLGREAGDDLLRFWASKTLENLSKEETVGRIEADHFAVLREIATEEQMRSDEKNVFEPVQNFFIKQGKENKVQISSGIYVLTPKDFRETDVDHMLDLAMVAEKRIRDSRETNFAFYNPEQWAEGKRIADVINYLPLALRSGDIQVWYQPQVNYQTGKIIGAEALCRWEHTVLGRLQPMDFISTLEEAGLIFELDSYVWNRVCQDLHRWNEHGAHRSVSVNVSRNDIREDRDLAGYFQNLIRTYELTADQIRIEITETAFAERPELLISTTEKLRACGFQVEMDDFGSGYSSLHMLKEVPVDRIKLDLHFLSSSGDAEKGRIIVSHIIQMIRALGMSMITEGVENISQAKFLREHGCDEMQGFYFYRPMPVKDLDVWDDQPGDTSSLRAWRNETGGTNG